MNPLVPVDIAVSSYMADILRLDYVDCLKPEFKRASALRGGLPVEPQYEVFNAFDHFAQAFQLAANDDGQGGNSSPAEIHLVLGRRHIAMGRIFCLQHQTVGIIAKIRSGLTNLPGERAEIHEPNETLVNDLEREFFAAAAFDSNSGATLPEMKQSLADFGVKIESLAELLLRLYAVFAAVEGVEMSEAFVAG